MVRLTLCLSVCALVSIPLQSAAAYTRCGDCSTYTCDEFDLGHRDCSESTQRGNTCCLDLTAKGAEVIDAYEGASVADEEEDCPPGFEEREQRCSQAERADGCRDIRLDSGKGCVSL